jgi:hypothetical protein
MLEITLFISRACLMSGKPMLKFCLRFLSCNFRLVKVHSKFLNTFGYSLLGPRREQDSDIFSTFSLVQAVCFRPLREEDRFRFVAKNVRCDKFLFEYCGCTCQYHSVNAPYSRSYQKDKPAKTRNQTNKQKMIPGKPESSGRKILSRIFGRKILSGIFLRETFCSTSQHPRPTTATIIIICSACHCILNTVEYATTNAEHYRPT